MIIKKIFNKYTTRVFKVVFLLYAVTLVSYSQEERLVQIKAGDLITYVDMYRGNFSIFDGGESNLDYASFLFGSSSAPSSFFEIYVEGQKQTLDQMIPEYPLGVSLNSQIDGIYLAGKNADIRIEFAFFPIDLIGNNDFNTVGLVLNISNLSAVKEQTISVRFLLDPDIGEARNTPLAFLPNGKAITSGTFLGENKIPPFLFFGQKNTAEQRPIGRGFYLYPFVAKKLPDYITVENWRLLQETPIHKTNNIVNRSLSYQANDLKDIGVSIVYDSFKLKPKSGENIGVVFSKNLTISWPSLEEDTIENGVFSTNRFEVEELLKKQNIPDFEQVLDEETLKKYIPLVKKIERNQQRSLYRKNLLYLDSHEKIGNSTKRSITIPKFDDTIKGTDGAWKYLYQLNWEMRAKETNIEQTLNLNPSQNTYTNIPDQGIQKKQFFSLD